MSISETDAERGSHENSPPTPVQGTAKQSNVAHNPLRGSYREVNTLIQEKTPGERLAEKPKSRKLAMEAMCWDCQGGDHADNGWKWQIGNCLSDTCPIWNFRPYQNKAGKPGEGVYKEYYGDGESQEVEDE